MERYLDAPLLLPPLLEHESRFLQLCKNCGWSVLGGWHVHTGHRLALSRHSHILLIGGGAVSLTSFSVLWPVMAAI